MCAGAGMTVMLHRNAETATRLRADNAKKHLALPLPNGHTSVSDYCANPKREKRGPTGQGKDCLSARVHFGPKLQYSHPKHHEHEVLTGAAADPNLNP